VQLFAAIHIDDIAVILYAGAGLSLEYKADSCAVQQTQKRLCSLHTVTAHGRFWPKADERVTAHFCF
jgi:hypothetical protein